ncbi:hypothetical protein HHI36_010261 [Cryptolaemus montrouzieri]|uniref:AMP-dependent synthetase/ligase domain-containing protein n=1 Tax=Cryptolaemus montrouzieri TaxID=559131 RepID=A0ABD2MI91_9CUCU
MAVNGVLRPIFSLSRRIQPTVSGRFMLSSSAANLNVVKSPLGDVNIPRTTIPEMIFSKTEKWGSYIATECSITGRKYTYDQIQKYSNNLAGVFRKKLKLNKGDVVGILMPNSPEYAIVALGILQGGLIATTLNPIYTPEEISRQLLDSGAKALVTISGLWSAAKSAVDLTRQSMPILAVNEKVSVLNNMVTTFTYPSINS